jgi:hypothetical protein
MTKKELLAKIEELERRIVMLEARPVYGYYPYWASPYPKNPWWAVSTTGSDTGTPLPELPRVF